MIKRILNSLELQSRDTLGLQISDLGFRISERRFQTYIKCIPHSEIERGRSPPQMTPYGTLDIPYVVIFQADL